MKHCDCCPTIYEHIAQHYDSMGLARPGDDPKKVLALFRQCFPDCDLTLWDVHEYLGMVEAR